jgi:hypothetical protein
MLVFPTDWSPKKTSLYLASGETVAAGVPITSRLPIDIPMMRITQHITQHLLFLLPLAPLCLSASLSLSASFSLTRTRADTEQSLVRKPRSEDYTGSEGPITAATRPVTATQIRGAAMDVSFAGPDNAVA